MVIHIRDKETEWLARQLAAVTGETVEQAIKQALIEKLERLKTSGRPERLSAEEEALRLKRIKTFLANRNPPLPFDKPDVKSAL